MEVTQTRAQGLKREFKVVVPAADLAERVEHQLATLRAKAHIPGFRPGKVPVSHLKRLYGRSIMAEVVQEAVNEAHRKIVEENQLNLAAQPTIGFAEEGQALDKMAEYPSDFAFTVALEVLPELEVSGLEEVEVERLTAEVSPEEIEQALTRLAEANRAYTPKDAEAAAAPGDKVILDFHGTLAGEPFEGGAGENVEVVLGSGRLLPGFEAQLEGMKAGGTRNVSVTFPEDYGVAKLAGKEAVFAVTLKAIEAPSALETGDDLAKGLGFEDSEKLKDAIRASIERDYSAASRAKWKRALLDALDKKYIFEVPESMVAQEFDAIWRTVEEEQKRSGRSFEDENTTEGAARADYRKIAERRVRLGLLLAEIGKKAGISISDEEVSQAVARRARAFPGQEKNIWDYYRAHPQALAEVRAPLFEEKVIDYIISQVKVTEKTVTKDELLKPSDEGEILAGGEEAAGAPSG